MSQPQQSKENSTTLVNWPQHHHLCVVHFDLGTTLVAFDFIEGDLALCWATKYRCFFIFFVLWWVFGLVQNQKMVHGVPSSFWLEGSRLILEVGITLSLLLPRSYLFLISLQLVNHSIPFSLSFLIFFLENVIFNRVFIWGTFLELLQFWGRVVFMVSLLDLKPFAPFSYCHNHIFLHFLFYMFYCDVLFLSTKVKIYVKFYE